MPSLDNDYGKIWADALLAEGGDPTAKALELQTYVEAIDRVATGAIKLPGLDGPTIADGVRDYVAARFSERIAVRHADNTWHRALAADLHRQAVCCLATGDLPGFAANPDAAELIHAYVRRKLLTTLGR